VAHASSGITAPRLKTPVLLSVVVHVALAGAFLFAARTPRVRGEVYSVNLIAAPPGPRQIGVVNDLPKAADAPIPKRAEVVPKETTPVPRRTTREATTTQSRATRTPESKSARFDTEAPRAGGGTTGGKGTDVANISTVGRDFPFPTYLTNIINQVAMRFSPRQRQLLAADIQFMIRRDGTVYGISIVKRSGSFGFDTEAKGAIEAAAAANAFGPLPDGFSDDVLTIIMTFDHTIIR
jgi:protein TonB